MDPEEKTPVCTGKSEETHIDPQVPAVEDVPAQQLVAVLFAFPVNMRTFDMNTCHSFEDLAQVVNETAANEMRLPVIVDPSVYDPVPGFRVKYFTKAEEDEELDPRTDSWERFKSELDRIHIFSPSRGDRLQLLE